MIKLRTLIQQLTPQGNPDYNRGFNDAKAAIMATIDHVVDEQHEELEKLRDRLVRLAAIKNEPIYVVEGNPGKDHRLDAYAIGPRKPRVNVWIDEAKNYELKGSEKRKAKEKIIHLGNDLVLVDEISLNLEEDETIISTCVHNDRLVVGTDDNRVLFFELEKPKLSAGDLQKMMRDPRYWRDKDPEYVKEVT